ncbi:MAG: restriction endonuclease subunit S [Chitinophagaceae bacterium]|nr:restriction endonuclease subunit S [Bacteroidota bacterium]MCA6489550.1 restriction endonuclease subunit S [Chitinophagaceae bacterium]
MKQAVANSKTKVNTKPFYNSVIPNDWETPVFGSIFTFLKTFSFSREQLTNVKTKDEVRNIHYGDIHATFENEILDLEIEKTIPYLLDGIIEHAKFEDDSFPSLKDGDLLIADASEDYEGVCDCVELKNVKGAKLISGLHTFAARTTEDKVALGFRTYTLKHEQVVRELRRIATGTSVYGISKTNLEKVRIPLPTLPEQKAIAKLLSTADATIHTTEKLIAQKEIRKKWLMQQLLTGKKRLKGFENTKWKIQPLENYIKPIIREVPKPSNPYLGIGLRSHGKGTFLKHDEQPEKNSMDKFYVVRPNDLIVNITFAWEQAIAIVRPEDDGALASHRFPTYTFIEEKGHADFFRFYILQPRMKFMLEMISPGGAGRNRVMSKSDFIKLEFLLPEYKEQKAIAQVLQAADKETSILKLKAEKLREKKKGLMQQLLTGKIRVK